MAEYIERETAVRIAKNYGQASILAAAVAKELADLPAADVEPVKHGQWGGESDGYAGTADGEMAPVVDVWYCSECGHCIDEGIDDETLLPNYCPHCGAHMDGEETKNEA